MAKAFLYKLCRKKIYVRKGGDSYINYRKINEDRKISNLKEVYKWHYLVNMLKGLINP
jgi:hypothetical protein